MGWPAWNLLPVFKRRTNAMADVRVSVNKMLMDMLIDFQSRVKQLEADLDLYRSRCICELADDDDEAAHECGWVVCGVCWNNAAAAHKKVVDQLQQRLATAEARIEEQDAQLRRGVAHAKERVDLLQRLEAAEAKLNAPRVRGSLAIDTDHGLFEGLALSCIEPEVLAATVHRERQRRLMLTAKNIELEAKLEAADARLNGDALYDKLLELKQRLAAAEGRCAELEDDAIKQSHFGGCNGGLSELECQWWHDRLVKAAAARAAGGRG